MVLKSMSGMLIKLPHSPDWIHVQTTNHEDGVDSLPPHFVMYINYQSNSTGSIRTGDLVLEQNTSGYNLTQDAL